MAVRVRIRVSHRSKDKKPWPHIEEGFRDLPAVPNVGDCIPATELGGLYQVGAAIYRDDHVELVVAYWNTEARLVEELAS